MTQTSIAGRTFSASDQTIFAVLSGDRNPMHMDNAAARRTQAGACVVHGINLFLWALEQLAARNLPIGRMAEAKVKFTGFVYLNQPIVLHLMKVDDAGLRIQLTAEASPVLTATLSFAEMHSVRHLDISTRMPIIVLGSAPLEPEFEMMVQQEGRLELPSGSLVRAEYLFPVLTEVIGATAICEIALLSTLVGMITPGLHSIFSELALTLHARDGQAVGCTFRGKRADPRFRIVELSTEGARVSATVTAFARFSPSLSPPMEKIAATVAPGEFRGRRALIIGGSRGIGAVTAKLIAAGGGSVTLSYAEGRTEAEAVHADILRYCGAGRSSLFRYRADVNAREQLNNLDGVFTHAYYFATPHIFGQSKAVYDREKFLRFVEIYVDGFYNLAVALLAKYSPKEMMLFYPSSVAVADRPKSMAEYSMAKAAGEILCADLKRAYRGLTITVPRLPRIQTDQTATVPPLPAADPLDIMLPLLRQERS